MYNSSVLHGLGASLQTASCMGRMFREPLHTPQTIRLLSRKHGSDRAATRSPEREQRSRAFLLTKTYMDAGYLPETREIPFSIR